MADVRFLLSGDSSVTVEFGNEISPAINAQIRAFTIALEESKLPGIVEVVPMLRRTAPEINGHNIFDAASLAAVLEKLN